MKMKEKIIFSAKLLPVKPIIFAVCKLKNIINN